MRLPPAAHVPEAQRAVKVARRDQPAVSRQRQRVAAGVAHQRAQAVALFQAPDLNKGAGWSGMSVRTGSSPPPGPIFALGSSQGARRPAGSAGRGAAACMPAHMPRGRSSPCASGRLRSADRQRWGALAGSGRADLYCAVGRAGGHHVRVGRAAPHAGHFAAVPRERQAQPPAAHIPNPHRL